MRSVSNGAELDEITYHNISEAKSKFWINVSVP